MTPGWPLNPGCGRDEADHLDHLGHRVQTDQRIHRRQRVERTDPRERLADLGGDVGPDLAGGGQLAVHERQLARGVNEVAGAHRGNVGRQRRDHLRKLDA